MFLFVKWMFTTVPSTLESQVCPVKANWTETDRQWSRQQHCRMLLFMLPITRTHQTHVHCKHTLKLNACLLGSHIHAHTHTHTHSPSSRQQGPVSDHSGAWICSVVRANDLRHMSSPCGFKTKHCQERSALAGQPAPCSAVLCMRRAIQSSKSKTKPIIILSHRSVLCPYRLLQTPRSPPPIWAAAVDLPARLERGPRHPGDWVHSHYPLRETLRGGPGTGEREGGRRGTRRKKMKKKVFVFACVWRESCRT